MHARAEIGRRFSVLVAIVAVNLLGIGAAHAQNVAPVISGTPSTSATPGQAYLFQPTASDANGDRISYGATGVPRWARFDRKSGRLYGTPTQRDASSTCTVGCSYCGAILTAVCFALVVAPPIKSGSVNFLRCISLAT